MAYTDNIFETAFDQLFQSNFNINKFAGEMDDNKGTFYRWCTTELNRATNDRLNIVETEFNSEQIIRYKRYEKILVRNDSLKILQKNNKASLFNNDFNLGIRFGKVLAYLEKKCKEEGQPRVKRGKIHLSTTTNSKFSSDIINVSKLQGTEFVSLVDLVRHKWNNYSKYIVEMERMLFYLQALYREKSQGAIKDHEKKGVSIFDLDISGKKKYTMFDHKSKTIVEKEDEKTTIEYVLFVFSHTDSRSSAYKELLSEMHESTKSSYHRSAEGEKEALAKLENISISSSDIQEILKYISKSEKKDERQLTHMDFDSAIKFFFILGENFFNNYVNYADALFNYYGKSLGEQIRDTIAEVFHSVKESTTAKKNLEDYKPSKILLREWEDKPPLRGTRMVLLTLPKFIISQHVEFTKPLVDMMGFISSMTDQDFETKNKFYNEIMNHPYMKRLNSTIRRRGIQTEVKAAFAQMCSRILMIRGKQKLYIEDLISMVMKDNRIDDKLFSGLKPMKIENNKKKREKELAELLQLQNKSSKETEKQSLEIKIKRTRKAIEDETLMNNSEIHTVMNLFFEYALKFIGELNREEERYFLHQEGSLTYITKKFNTSIENSQKKQIAQRERDKEFKE